MAVSSVPIFNSLKPPSASLIACSTVHSRSPSSLGYNSFWVKGGFVCSSVSESSRVRAIVRDKGERTEDHPLVGDLVDNVGNKQVLWPRLPERDFAGTPYVPVYVMLPLGVVDMNCELVEKEGLVDQLRILKSVNVDGVMVDCWWGIVEAHMPQVYNWSGYKRLFHIVRDLGLKLQVYFDYMRSFRVEFDEFFVDGVISEIELGLGPCGELRYPSYPAKHGWRYPGIGEFQCYDKYLMKSLSKAAEIRGHSFWARGPDNAGSYNSAPHETGFFRDGGDYDSYYGRFFLNWYSQVLVDHGDRVLALANLAFEGTCIAAKLSGIHWWYKTASHAAELTAGFHNPANRDGYAPIAVMLKKHGVALNFTCVELRTLDQHEDFPEALADPEGLVWQVLNAAWDVSILVASENALPCYDREGYNKILENAKPRNDPDGRHLSAFTYLRLSPVLMERHNFAEFERFVKRMHGAIYLHFSHLFLLLKRADLPMYGRCDLAQGTLISRFELALLLHVYKLLTFYQLIETHELSHLHLQGKQYQISNCFQMKSRLHLTGRMDKSLLRGRKIHVTFVHDFMQITTDIYIYIYIYIYAYDHDSFK
ncbi:beta-amylase 2, chloroplastic-like isoform X2 [Durio zibethinus]|uniref:Beta-amylase n=1 Tax=Durio zibethinus TaxID=66656 RepID=A0A6P5ZXS6_DURZI|nr:beta-amylase 2, chloroplastic-like isoform X2 [Durio zibethinus]